MTVEREMKLALPDPASLARLISVLPEPVRIEAQHNRYFDAPDGRLTRRQTLVRLRQYDADRVQLTIKRAASQRADGTFEAEENEAWLGPDLGREWFSSQQPFRSGACATLDALVPELGDVRDLVRWGEMRNTRRVFVIEGSTFEVDETDFGDGAFDAEIEIETVDPAVTKLLLDPYLRQARVDCVPQIRTKSARLLERSQWPPKEE